MKALTSEGGMGWPSSDPVPAATGEDGSGCPTWSLIAVSETPQNSLKQLSFSVHRALAPGHPSLLVDTSQDAELLHKMMAQ